MRGSHVYDLFANAKEGTILKTIFDDKMNADRGTFTDTNDQGIKKMINEKYVFVMYETFILGMPEERCKITKLPFSNQYLQ